MTFADKVSSIRIILIPAFVSLLIYSRHDPSLKYLAVGVFFLAVLTDFFDGLVARIKKEKSELGQIIDPLADKLLMLAAFLSLYLLKFNIPLAVVLVVVSRDAVILVGALILSFLKITVQISPSLCGKLTTFFQMLTIFCVLLDAKFSAFIWTLAVVFTLISGIGYFIRGVRAINAHNSTSDN